MEQISLVLTVKNEEKTITRLLESIIRQTRMPEEIVVVDGGSSDNTVSVIKDFGDRLSQLKVVVEPGANISQGRNRGIEESQYDVIAVTDAGCRLDPLWLETLSEKLDPAVIWCAGDHVPEAKNAFEEIAGKCSTEGYFTADHKKFKATARNLLFRKKAWEEVGGFPEYLEISEDAFFILKLLDKRYKFHYVPQAKVFWRPRSSYGEVFKQFYNYAYWAVRGGIFLKVYWKPLLQQIILVFSFGLWLLLKKFYWLFLGLGLVGVYFVRKFRTEVFGVFSVRKLVWVVSIQTLIQMGIFFGMIIGSFACLLGKLPRKNAN